jgi:hypothetical protein
MRGWHEVRCAHLVCKQQANGLQALLPTVNIVAQEQVVGLWRKATVLEQPQQVRILPMNVACRGEVSADYITFAADDIMLLECLAASAYFVPASLVDHSMS